MSPKDFKTQVELVETLFARYQDAMKRLAGSIMKDFHEADDILQLSMMKIMKNIDKIDNIDTDRCRHFVLVITKNTALTELQKKKNRKSVTTDPSEIVNIVQGEVIDYLKFEENYGFSSEIMALMEALSETDKDILCLKYGNDYSDAEIGEMLEISDVAVRKRLSRARKRLEVLLSDEETEK